MPMKSRSRTFTRFCPRVRGFASGGISPRGGFTLVELVLVMAILVMVLTATYRLILDCLDAERTIDKLTLPEKVGEGILSLFRADLSGTIWRQLGTRVFYVIDNGDQRDARDEIRFLSTIEPTPHEEAARGTTVQVSELRTITGICYFLKPNQGIDGIPTLSLYRKEIVEFAQESPLESPGRNYEVFDKVAYLSIKCYYPNLDLLDPWVPYWDSEEMIQNEQLDLEAQAGEKQGIAKVKKRSDRLEAPVSRGNLAAAGAPGVDPGAAGGETELLPPAAVPSAVRLEIGIYAGQGNRIERDPQGNPIVKTYATIVPILTAQRVRIETSEDFDLGGEESEGAGAAAAAGGGATGVQLGGRDGSGAPGSVRGAPGAPGARSRPGRSAAGAGPDGRGSPPPPRGGRGGKTVRPPSIDSLLKSKR